MEYYIIKKNHKYLKDHSIKDSKFRFKWTTKKVEAKLFKPELLVDLIAHRCIGKVVVYSPKTKK